MALVLDGTNGPTFPSGSVPVTSLGLTRTITDTDTIVAADCGKLLLLNKATAFTLSITAAATLGNGFFCKFKNIGAGLVTLDPAGAETVDGYTTSNIPIQDGGELYCTGSAFHTVNRSTRVLLSSGVVANGTASLELDMPEGYENFELELFQFEPVNSTAMLLTLSQDGGSSYLSSYKWAGLYCVTGTGPTRYDDGVAARTTAIELSAGIMMAGSGTEASFWVSLQRGASGNYGPSIKWVSEHRISTPAAIYYSGASNCGSTTGACNRLKVAPASGNLYQGRYAIYGIRR